MKSRGSVQKSREEESISKFACLIKCTQPLQAARGNVWKRGDVLLVMAVMQILMYMCPLPKILTAEMGGVVGKEKEGIEIFVTGREGKQLCQGLGHFCKPATKEQQQGLSLGPAMNSIEPQMCRCSHFPDISNPLNRIWDAKISHTDWFQSEEQKVNRERGASS